MSKAISTQVIYLLALLALRLKRLAKGNAYFGSSDEPTFFGHIKLNTDKIKPSCTCR
jgi:hypothetical protein